MELTNDNYDKFSEENERFVTMLCVLAVDGGIPSVSLLLQLRTNVRSLQRHNADVEGACAPL